jgi:hypothetical protein
MFLIDHCVFDVVRPQLKLVSSPQHGAARRVLHMLDFSREQPLPLAKAAQLVKIGIHGSACVATLYRWKTHGKRGIILETRPYMGILCTSAEALARFNLALEHVSRPNPPHLAIKRRKPRARAKAAAAAARRLAAKGA